MPIMQIINNKNNINIYVIDELGERKCGINSWDELPDRFERKQFLDENYKIGNGENQREVRDRMYNAIHKVLNDNKGKRIVVVSHGTAISFVLKKWCKIDIHDDKLRYTYNDKIIHEGYFNNCETFKLEFDDDNNLINIENIIFDL